MAGHKPFSELRKDIDASPERLANVARERQEVEMDADREELIALIGRAIEDVTGYGASVIKCRGIANALLADGRWLLVHPDEMPEYEQVGWGRDIRAACSEVTMETARGWLLRDGFDAPNAGYEPVFRVRPAVEKETAPDCSRGHGPMDRSPWSNRWRCEMCGELAPAVEKENDQ